MLVMSHFDRVSEMNVAFNNPKGDPHNIDWRRVQRQVSNIAGAEYNEPPRDEYDELMIAVDRQDVVGVRDALCDIMVFALGAFHMMGYDADEDMHEVVDSVMSRLCRDEEQLAATLTKYTDMGLVVHAEGEFPRVCVKSSCEQVDRNGERYAQGKFLKAVGYRQPKLDPL